MRKRVSAYLLVLIMLLNLVVLPISADEQGGSSDPSITSEGQGGDNQTGDGGTDSDPAPCTHTGTWTNAGDTHTRTCTSCGAQESGAHSWGQLTVTTAPTCTEKGAGTKICSVCQVNKVEEVAATGHTYGNWEKVDGTSHKHTCTVTGCTASETVAHSWGEGQVSVQATCLVKGQKVYNCACGDTKLEEVPLAAHSYGAWGGDLSKHSRVCSVCEHVDAGNHIWDEGKVLQETTCKDEGKTQFTCLTCSVILEETYEKLTTHTYDNVCDPECNICGIKRLTEHKYSTIWSKDQTGHWHTCTGCNDKEDFAKHLAGPGATEEKAQTCVVCSFVLTPKLKHTHKYEKKYSSNELGHWHACEGCEEESGFAEHVVDGICDTECDTCGYKFKATHIFGGDWESDETGHWNQCTLCGEKNDLEDHVPYPGAKENEAKYCSVCGYEISPAVEHTHTAVDGWQYNDSNHWWDCECGEKQEESAHVWDDGTPSKDATVTYTCTVCQAERTIEVSSGRGTSVVVLIVLIVLVIAFIATVVVLIFLLRGNRGSGKFSK